MDAKETEMPDVPNDPGYPPPPPPQSPPPAYRAAPYPYEQPPGGYPPPPPPRGLAEPGPWGQHPGGPAYPPHPPAPPYRPRGKGFFASLFDLSFDDLITIRVIKLIYVLMILFITGIALFMLYQAWGFFLWNGTLGIITVIAVPLAWIWAILIARLVLEFVIVQFKIADHLKIIRDKGKSG